MKRLLFIEDDRLAGKMYQCSLQLEGFKVELVEDGETGLATLNRCRPDLVILDLMLPRTSGVQVLHQIRSQPATRGLPVIVLTNAFGSPLTEDAWKAGANICLSKSSTTPPKLAQAVRTHLTNHTATQPAPSADPAPAEDQTGLESDADAALWESISTVSAGLQGLAHEFLQREEDLHRVTLLTRLRHHAHFVAANAAVMKAEAIVRMAAALEELLKELEENHSKISPSTVRTVGQAVEFLSLLVRLRGSSAAQSEASPFEVLIVDDDALTLQAVTHALERAAIRCSALEGGLAAYHRSVNQRWDGVIIDIRMPGMDGFELCKKLRALPMHKHTPIIFLTRLNDFDNRVRSARSGGDDFIAKPFLFIELTVKALIHGMRNRLAFRSPKVSPFLPLA